MRQVSQLMTVLALSVLVGVVAGLAAFHWAGHLRSSSGRRIGSAASPLGESVFQAICEAAPNAIVVSRAGQSIWVNPQYRVLFGCSAETVVGQKLALLLPQAGARVATRQDGSYFPVEVRQYPVSSATDGRSVASCKRRPRSRERATRVLALDHGHQLVHLVRVCIHVVDGAFRARPLSLRASRSLRARLVVPSASVVSGTSSGLSV